MEGGLGVGVSGDMWCVEGGLRVGVSGDVVCGGGIGCGCEW